MYCFRCGNNTQDQTSVCPYCGQSFGTLAVPQTNAAPMMMYPYPNPVQDRFNLRNREMEELNKMLYHFSQKQAQYNEYDSLCEKANQAKDNRGGFLAWGIILFMIALLAFLAYIAYYTNKPYGPGVSTFVITALVYFFPGVTFILSYVFTTRARSKNRAAINRRYDELSYELYSHYIAYGPCLVGCEYTNPSNLAVILYTIQSGRADTIRDAINLLAEENYRRNMQAIAQQTARSAAAAARGARTAAVFSAANFFLR